MAQLVVIYDPAENRNNLCSGGKTMTDGSWGHHWTRFPNAPFRDVQTVFIKKDLRMHDGRELFETLNSVLYRNIDYSFIWLEEPLHTSTLNHAEKQNLVIDHIDDLDDNINELDVERLRKLTEKDVFLAIEMTEHNPFGSNQLRKVGILDLYAHHGVPTIFVASRSGYRAQGQDLGTVFKTRIVNHAQNIALLVPLIESDTPLPSYSTTSPNLGIFALPGSVIPPTRYLPLQSMKLEKGYTWMDQIIRILFHSKPAPVVSFSDFVTSSWMPDGYQFIPSKIQPLMDVIKDAIRLVRSGNPVDSALDSLWTTNIGTTHRKAANKHPQLTNWYLANGGLPSTASKIPTDPSFNPLDNDHFHGSRSGTRPPKAMFSDWISLGGMNIGFELHLNKERTRMGLTPMSRTSVPFPSNWEHSEGILCWNSAARTTLWNQNEYMSILMDFMWCRKITGFMQASPRNDRRLLFGINLSKAGENYRTSNDVFSAIANQSNTTVLELAEYTDFISLDDGVFLGPQWWDLYGGMAKVAANPDLVRLM